MGSCWKHSMAGVEQQSRENLTEGSDPGSYLLLIFKQIAIKQTTHRSEINLGLVCQKFSLCKLFSSFWFFFHSLCLAIFWVNTSLLPVAASFITWESVAWSFLNGYKLIKVGWKTLEAFPAGDEIYSISKHFMLIKFWSTVWIAGDSDNVKIS